MTTEAIAGGPPPLGIEKPTGVRHVVLTLAVAVAVLLYLDRYCLSTADRDIKASLGLSEAEVSVILSIFYLPYAFGQLVLGYLADRFGARKTLTLSMIAWSTVTGLMGFANSYWELVLCRFSCGLFESGAYPACAGMIRRWIPLEKRGMASGIVSLGGRLGGVITPKLTVMLMAAAAVVLPDFASWRPVFVFYGLFGIGLAIVFWILHRDRPELHPGVNAAERDLIVAGDPPPAAVPLSASRFVLAIVSNRSLWLSSVYQVGSNFGWVFLLTLLNRYLLEVHHADTQTRGTIVSLIVLMSLPALFLGGGLTDIATRRIGRRWAALPISIPRFISGGLYFTVGLLSIAWLTPNDVLVEPTLTTTQSWSIVLLLGFVAFFNDLTLPAVWAFSLDIGGRNVGFVLGWSNMWGNLGALVSPLILNELVRLYGWNSVFWTCGSVFLVIAVLSLLINANETVEA